MTLFSGVRALEIRTDSQFVIDCHTKWVQGWMNNGWRTANGEPVVNRPELELLLNASDGMNIRYVR